MGRNVRDAARSGGGRRSVVLGAVLAVAVTAAACSSAPASHGTTATTVAGKHPHTTTTTTVPSSHGTATTAAHSPSTTAPGGRSTTTAPTNGHGTTATTGAGPVTTTASDVALAQSELLPASAFPTGWTGQGSGSGTTGAGFFSGSDASIASAMEQCLGVDAGQVDTDPAEAAGQQYDDPDTGASISDTVDVYPTSAPAVTDAQAYANPKTPGCYQQVITQKMAQELGAVGGASLGHVTITQPSMPAYGQHDADLSITVPLTTNGTSSTLCIDLVAVQKGRSVSHLQFLGYGSPASPSTIDAMASAAAARLTT